MGARGLPYLFKREKDRHCSDEQEDGIEEIGEHIGPTLHPSNAVLTAQDGVFPKDVGMVLHGIGQEATKYWTNNYSWLGLFNIKKKLGAQKNAKRN